MKKKFFLIIAGILIVYEAAFRLCTMEWGEVNVNLETKSAFLYYSGNLFVSGTVLDNLFYIRTRLPLGRVRLANTPRVYWVDGYICRQDAHGNMDRLNDIFKDVNMENVKRRLESGGASGSNPKTEGSGSNPETANKKHENSAN